MSGLTKALTYLSNNPSKHLYVNHRVDSFARSKYRLLRVTHCLPMLTLFSGLLNALSSPLNPFQSTVKHFSVDCS